MQTLCERRAHARGRGIFCLTLAWRGRNVHFHRITDASDSETVYGIGTDERVTR
jgi:hypothetical protein